MKARKVMVHLELKSDIPVIGLQSRGDWQLAMKQFSQWGGKTEVHQVSVQVVKEGK